MATKFNQVKLDSIEQGNFLIAADAEFQTVIDKLLAYIDQHTAGFSEEQKTKFSAKAGLTLSVGLEYSKGVYHIKTDIDKKLPKRPSGISSAFCSEDEEREGGMALFSQAGGTREGNPHQQTFV